MCEQSRYRPIRQNRGVHLISALLLSFLLPISAAHAAELQLLKGAKTAVFFVYADVDKACDTSESDIRSAADFPLSASALKIVDKSADFALSIRVMTLVVRSVGGQNFIGCATYLEIEALVFDDASILFNQLVRTASVILYSDTQLIFSGPTNKGRYIKESVEGMMKKFVTTYNNDQK
jgi:hypothetical protein